MEQIGIFGEFFRAGNEYALRHYSETDYLDGEVINFTSHLKKVFWPNIIVGGEI
jgi:hypothetical protein